MAVTREQALKELDGYVTTTSLPNGRREDCFPEGRKDDLGKSGFEYLPADALGAINEVLIFGAKKYGARNWEKGMRWTRPANAALRHLFAWLRGEKADKETGFSHLWHLGCCVLFLIAYELRAVGEDDRC